MRFALIATAAAALIASPAVLAAAGPQMTGDQFVSAVRCTAYDQAVQPQADLSDAKFRLNSEARHQAPETAAQARAEVTVIAKQAAGVETSAEAAMMHRERAAACAGAATLATATFTQTAV